MIKVADKSKVVKQWSSRNYFPQDNYVVRVLNQENKPSNAGNPMMVLEFEIVNCDAKKIGDETLEFDGVTFTHWQTTGCNPPKNATEKEIAEAKQADDNAFNNADDLLTRCGIDTSEGWDPTNPPSIKGKVLHVRLYGSDESPTKAPTPEQKAKGERGDPLKDPVTGKELHMYKIKLAEVYGVCDDPVRPF